MKYVDIESRFGDIVMRLTGVRNPWDETATRPAWDVQVTAPELDASGVFPEDPEAPQTLAEFLRELDDHHQGFDGAKTWESLGGGLKIRADHDQINTTRLYVSMTCGVNPPWSVDVELHVDPRRFDRVSLNLDIYAEELFGDEFDPDAEPIRIDPRQRAREGVRKIGSMAIKRSDPD